MDRSADTYWLALRRVRGIGPRTAHLLLEHFGDAERIFKASEAEVAQAGVPRNVVKSLSDFDDFAEVEKELCEITRVGARLIRWTDPDYPVNLRHIADPPPLLYARGEMHPDDVRFVAVVGARAASDAGLRMANRLGFELAARQLTVVSGLARGVDGAAHQGALDAGGRTVAVMGCGIDVIYPPEHRKLADAMIANHGALLSELPCGTPPIAENFPTRNRILSGLALGVVIVEAAEKSGSLITARMALEQNRQVFAVPGSPLNGKTRGSNRLLKEGALLVDCVEDVIEELAPQLGKLSSAETSNEAARAGGLAKMPSRAQKFNESNNLAKIDERPQVKAILSCLSDSERLHVDAIIEGSGLNPQTVLEYLLELELEGAVVQHPGKLFSLS